MGNMIAAVKEECDSKSATLVTSGDTSKTITGCSSISLPTTSSLNEVAIPPPHPQIIQQNKHSSALLSSPGINMGSFGFVIAILLLIVGLVRAQLIRSKVNMETTYNASTSEGTLNLDDKNIGGWQLIDPRDGLVWEVINIYDNRIFCIMSSILYEVDNYNVRLGVLRDKAVCEGLTKGYIEENEDTIIKTIKAINYHGDDYHLPFNYQNFTSKLRDGIPKDRNILDYLTCTFSVLQFEKREKICTDHYTRRGSECRVNADCPWVNSSEILIHGLAFESKGHIFLAENFTKYFTTDYFSLSGHMSKKYRMQ